MNLLSGKRMGGSVIMHNLWAWRIYLELATNSSVRRLKRCRCILYVLRDTYVQDNVTYTWTLSVSGEDALVRFLYFTRRSHLCECIHICVCERTAVVQRWWRICSRTEYLCVSVCVCACVYMQVYVCVYECIYRSSMYIGVQWRWWEVTRLMTSSGPDLNRGCIFRLKLYFFFFSLYLYVYVLIIF